MNRVAISLVVTFLGISAWLPFQMIGHGQTHAHHEATTHATPLCTLFCSAGQMAHIADPTPAFSQNYAFNLETPIFISHLAIQLSLLPARAPPAHFPSFLIF